MTPAPEQSSVCGKIIMSFDSIQKTLGCTLLVVGLLLISVPLWQTYMIFSGKASAPEVFHIKKVDASTPKPNAFDIQKQVEQALVNILPIDLIDKTLNLISWTLLLFILMYGGRHISYIGIQLMKNGTNSQK